MYVVVVGGGVDVGMQLFKNFMEILNTTYNTRYIERNLSLILTATTMRMMTAMIMMMEFEDDTDAFNYNVI